MDKINDMDEKHYIFNWKLARRIGLYQILNPNTTKFYGYNVYRIVVMFFTVYLLAVSIMSLFNMFYSTNDIIQFVMYMGSGITFLFCAYKNVIIMYHSKSIWKFLEVTHCDFITYKYYSKNIFKDWYIYLNRILYAYFMIICWGLVFMYAVPYMLTGDAKIKIQNINGSYGDYRINVLNLFQILLSPTYYNDNFNLFYYNEVIISIISVYSILMFDIINLIISFAICGQLSTICAEIESLGHKTQSTEYKLSMYN